MKTFAVALISFTAALSLFLVPFHTQKTGAYPENLWTADAQWSKRADPARIFVCDRTEMGLIWSWMVYDKGKYEDAWYLKLDRRMLIFYLLAAVGISVCSVLVHRRTSCRS